MSILDAFKETLRKWKYVDILINNAGMFNDRQYETEIATNVVGIRSPLVFSDIFILLLELIF